MLYVCKYIHPLGMSWEKFAEKAERGHSSFVKLGARKYLVISIAMVACKINLNGDIISDIAISIGSCSAVARRLGVDCAPVNFPSHFLLCWDEHPE